MHMYWCAKPEENHNVCPEKPLEQIFGLEGTIPADDPLFDFSD